MQRYRFLIIILLSLIKMGCQPISTIGYLDDHPEFSPIAPRAGKTEYQVILARSFKPTIYIRAYLESDSLEENTKAYIAYSVSKNHVEKLTKVEISMEDWKQVSATFENSSFWSHKDVCAELSYQKRTILLDGKNGCEEIIMTDGSLLTIAACENGRSKGISLPLSDSSISMQLIEIPRVLLKSIGKENLLD